MTLYFAVGGKTAGDKLARVPELAGEAVAALGTCTLVRCAATGVGSGAIAFELVYDDKTLDNNRGAENRSAILLTLLERLRAGKIDLIRASDIPPPLAPF
jgi:hypothetical protein